MADPVLFDRYRLLERVGSGGTAAVWRALDQRTGEEVALKRLHPVVFGSEAGRRRLVREFRALRGLRHPNVVRVRDLEMTRDEAALVLDYVPGPSLRDRLAGGARMPAGEAVRIAEQVAAALDAAHAAGLVHRDVSPGNVLVDGDGTARLTDFGIADEGTDETAVTATGTLVGTLRYVAPEQLRGEPATRRSDVFGLAAITYEMLAGRPAFAASTPVGLVEAQRGGPSPIEGVDPAVEAVIREALAEDASGRPASASAFVDRLRDAVEGRSGDVTAAVAPVLVPPPAQPEAATSPPAGPAAVPSPTVRPRPAPRRAAGAIAAAAALALGGLILAAALAGQGLPGDRDGGTGAVTPAPATTEPTAAPVADEADDGGKPDKDDGGGNGNGRGNGDDNPGRGKGKDD